MTKEFLFLIPENPFQKGVWHISGCTIQNSKTKNYIENYADEFWFLNPRFNNDTPPVMKIAAPNSNSFI